MEEKYQSQLDSMKETANKLVSQNNRQKEIIAKNSTRREHLHNELELTKGMFTAREKNNIRRSQELEKELKDMRETLKIAQEERYQQDLSRLVLV
jgi:hypothetical protein